VIDYGGGRSHWIVKGPAGTEVEWESVITAADRPRSLSWRTEPGSMVQHIGTVNFEPSHGGTRVTVNITYNAAGTIGNTLASLLGSDPGRLLDEDLARIKAHLEGRAFDGQSAAPTEPPRPDQALH
jgi:uncharacterized membrane protein